MFSVKTERSFIKDAKGIRRQVVGNTKKIYKGFGVRTRALIDKKGSFPTGLLYLLDSVLGLLSHTLVVKDLRTRPKALEGVTTLFQPSHMVVPYPEQQDAANSAVAHHRGILCAPTGSGKTLIMALIIDQLKVHTMIVVPSLGLKKQVTEAMTRCFGEEKVGKNRLIQIENVDALDPKKIMQGVDCVIIDEFHHGAAVTYRKLNKKAWNGIYYKLGLSATPFRTDDSERLLLESVLSKVIYRLPYEKAVEKGYVVPVEAYYYDLPKIEVKGSEYDWATIYSELVVNRKDRNDIIKNIVNTLNSQMKSSICLVKEIGHGQKIKELLNFDCPFMQGVNADNPQLLELFNGGWVKSLIGTSGVLGEGIDTRPAEYIILAGLGKAKGQFMQQVGRGSRIYQGKESCKIILFRDPSHKWTLNHFKEQCKILREEYGVSPVKLEI